MLDVTENREEIHIRNRLVVGVDVSTDEPGAYVEHLRSDDRSV